MVTKSKNSSKIQCTFFSLVLAANVLRTVAAGDFSSHIGNLFSEPSSDGNFDSNGRIFPTSNSRTTGNIGFELKQNGGFRCDHKLGYFADIDSGCQLFHVCAPGAAHYQFWCPAGTQFNQRFLVCDWPYNVDCPASERFFTNIFQEPQPAPTGFIPRSQEFQRSLPEPSTSGLGSGPTTLYDNTSERKPRNVSIVEFADSSNPKAYDPNTSRNVNATPSPSTTGRPPQEARTLPPKIIFAFPTDTNSGLSLPQLLEDLKVPKDSPQGTGRENDGTNFYFSNQNDESDFKKLPKRQVATIVSTLQKLSMAESANAADGRRKAKESSLLKSNQLTNRDVSRTEASSSNQGQFSYQSIKFGTLAPTEQPRNFGTNQLEYSDKRNKDCCKQSDNFNPITPNDLPSVPMTTPTVMLTAVAFEKVSDITSSPAQSGRHFKPSQRFQLKPTPIDAQFHPSVSQVQQKTILTSTELRSTKAESTDFQRQVSSKKEAVKSNIEDQRKLDDQENSTGYIRVGKERSFFNQRAQNGVNSKAKNIEGTRALQNKRNYIPTKASNKNFHQSDKAKKLVSSDDWSLKTSESQNSQQIVEFPNFDFPSVSSFSKSIAAGRSAPPETVQVSTKDRSSRQSTDIRSDAKSLVKISSEKNEAEMLVSSAGRELPSIDFVPNSLVTTSENPNIPDTTPSLNGKNKRRKFSLKLPSISSLFAPINESDGKFLSEDRTLDLEDKQFPKKDQPQWAPVTFPPFEISDSRQKLIKEPSIRFSTPGLSPSILLSGLKKYNKLPSSTKETLETASLNPTTPLTPILISSDPYYRDSPVVNIDYKESKSDSQVEIKRLNQKQESLKNFTGITRDLKESTSVVTPFSSAKDYSNFNEATSTLNQTSTTQVKRRWPLREFLNSRIKTLEAEEGARIKNKITRKTSWTQNLLNKENKLKETKEALNQTEESPSSMKVHLKNDATLFEETLMDLNSSSTSNPVSELRVTKRMAVFGQKFKLHNGSSN